MSLLEPGQHGVIDRLHGRRDEQATGVAQDAHQLDVPDDVFHLDHDVVGEAWPLARESFDDAPRVGGAVEEVGIPERDVLRAGRHLVPDVPEHRVGLHHAELTVVHGHDRAVTASVLAPAGRLRVARNPALTGRQLQGGVSVERGQPGAVRRDEPQPRQGVRSGVGGNHPG